MGAKLADPSGLASSVTTLPASSSLFLMFRLPRTLLASFGSTRRSVTRIEIVVWFLAARSDVPADAGAEPTPTSAGVAATATATTAPTKDFHLLVMQLHLSWGPERTALTPISVGRRRCVTAALESVALDAGEAARTRTGSPHVVRLEARRRRTHGARARRHVLGARPGADAGRQRQGQHPQGQGRQRHPQGQGRQRQAPQGRRRQRQVATAAGGRPRSRAATATTSTAAAAATTRSRPSTATTSSGGKRATTSSRAARATTTSTAATATTTSTAATATTRLTTGPATTRSPPTSGTTSSPRAGQGHRVRRGGLQHVYVTAGRRPRQDLLRRGPQRHDRVRRRTETPSTTSPTARSPRLSNSWARSSPRHTPRY